MPVQDDEREREMRQLFNLRIAPERSRSDIDAYLKLGEETINFELKSTTGKGFSTVRDLGPDHLAKWRDGLHWIFAVYSDGGAHLDYCYYASPADMEPWFEAKEQYIAPDLALADALPPMASEQQVIDAFGSKQTYTTAEAKRIMKNQWSAEEYKTQQDVPEGGFSLARMTDLMQRRARYLLLRGSTLNNPHVPMGYFTDFEKIEEEHASRLRELVQGYLSTSATEAATA